MSYETKNRFCPECGKIEMVTLLNGSGFGCEGMNEHITLFKTDLNFYCENCKLEFKVIIEYKNK